MGLQEKKVGDLELRVERLEVQVDGLIRSLHTLVESLAVAIGRDDVVPHEDVVPASKKFDGLWTAEDVAKFIDHDHAQEAPEPSLEEKRKRVRDFKNSPGWSPQEGHVFGERD